MHVLYVVYVAIGATPPTSLVYYLNPGSGIEAGIVSFTRSNTRLNASGICREEFGAGCNVQEQSCDYQATWEVQGFSVEYTVTARQVSG